MKTLASVQALRALAALLVALAHSVNAADHDMPALREVLKTLANIGVHIFFVISGFIMVWCNRHRFGDLRYAPTFLRKRLVRIYPVYWALAAINLPLLWYQDLLSFRTTQMLVESFFLWPTQNGTLIFVGWTLSYELFFYLCFCLVLAVPARFTLPALTALLCGLVGLRFVVPGQGAVWHLVTNTLLLEFLYGAWIAWWFAREPRLPRGTGLLATLGGASALAAVALLGDAGLPTVIAAGLPSALLVAGAVQFEREGRGARLCAPGQRLGDASYSLYLGHAVIVPIAAYLTIHGQPLSPLATLVWGAAVLGLSVWASLRFSERVEMPLIGFLNRRLAAPAPAGAGTGGARSTGHRAP